MNTAIVNGRVVDPAAGSIARGGVYIANGRIAASRRGARRLPRRAHASTRRGLVVAPGLVDLCARLREPGADGRAQGRNARRARRRRHRRRVPAGHRSAARRAGPGADAAAALARVRRRAHLSARRADRRAQGRSARRDRRRWPRPAVSPSCRPTACRTTTACCCRRCATRAPSICRVAAPGRGHARRQRRRGGGPVAARLGLSVDPGGGGDRGAAHDLRAAGAPPARACTCAACRRPQGIELVRHAKREGLPVTCDVTIHHVHLIDVDIGYFDAELPPRSAAALAARPRCDPSPAWPTARSTRSAPITRRSAATRSCCRSPKRRPARSGLETLLPLVLKWAVADRVDLLDALAKVTASSARILGEDTGPLTLGAKADIAVFDPRAAGSSVRTRCAPAARARRSTATSWKARCATRSSAASCASSAECATSWHRCAPRRCCCMCSAAS